MQGEIASMATSKSNMVCSELQDSRAHNPFLYTMVFVQIKQMKNNVLISELLEVLVGGFVTSNRTELTDPIYQSLC